jgi:hypothetical protein
MYIRPEVVGPCASGSYVHRAALFVLFQYGIAVYFISSEISVVDLCSSFLLRGNYVTYHHNLIIFPIALLLP